MAGPHGSPVPSGPVPAFAGRHYQFQAPPGAGPPGPFLAGGACPAPTRIGVSVRGRRLLPGVSLAAAGASWAPCVPLRMRWLGGCCLSPAALAAAGPGDDGLLFRIVKPSYRCTPAAALPWPLRSEGMARAGSGAAVPPLAGTCITWAAPSFHDQNVLGRNFSCMLKEQLLPENYTRWQVIPVTWAGPPREPTGRATAQPAGFLPGTILQ